MASLQAIMEKKIFPFVIRMHPACLLAAGMLIIFTPLLSIFREFIVHQRSRGGLAAIDVTFFQLGFKIFL